MTETEANTSQEALGTEALHVLAGSVHTYESLGRAIVADALAQAAAGKLDDGTLTASITVRPAGRPQHVEPPPTAGAAGEYTGHAGCVSVTIFVGTHIYPLQVCSPL